MARLLLAECNGGNCPQIERDGDDWLVQGYDENGVERKVKIPASLGHRAAAIDTEQP